MFKRTGVNVIESDEGFSVAVLGRVGLLYREGQRSLHIDAEVNSSTEIALFKESIRAWDPPNDGEIIDDKKRDQIVENIRRAFLSQRTGVVIL